MYIQAVMCIPKMIYTPSSSIRHFMKFMLCNENLVHVSISAYHSCNPWFDPSRGHKTFELIRIAPYNLWYKSCLLPILGKNLAQKGPKMVQN